MSVSASVGPPAPAPDTIRVCVIDSRAGPAYPRLAECAGLDVVGKIPWLDVRFLPPQLLEDASVILVGTDPDMLADAAAQAQLVRLTRRTNVVAVASRPCDPEPIAQLGMRGLVARDVDPAALMRVVRAVAAGEMAFPRSALTALLGLVGKLPITLPGVPNASLTPRQREVVALIAAGATDREVALRLRISESTAHKHVQNALRRSRAKTRSQLVGLLRQDALSSS